MPVNDQMTLPPDDADLPAMVEAVAGSDRQSFAVLFEHFAPRLKGFFLKGGADHSSADELVQDVMLTLWRKAHLYSPEKASVPTWVFTIARNKKIDAIRRARRFEEPEDDTTPVLEDDGPGPEGILAAQQESRRLKEMLAALPVDQREVLELSYFSDLSHGEIAHDLQIPLGTVKSRLRLGLGRLRSAFQENGNVR